MVIQPNEQRRAWLKALREHITTLADGTRVSWVELEQKTGVPCGPKSPGRGLFRIAVKRCGRRYEPLHGDGFEMSAPSNANDIVDRAVRRVGTHLTLAKDTTEIIAGRHLDEMSGDNRKRIEHQRAALSTIGLSATLARRPELPGKT